MFSVLGAPWVLTKSDNHCTNEHSYVQTDLQSTKDQYPQLVLMANYSFRTVMEGMEAFQTIPRKNHAKRSVGAKRKRSTRNKRKAHGVVPSWLGENSKVMECTQRIERPYDLC